MGLWGLSGLYGVIGVSLGCYWDVVGMLLGGSWGCNGAVIWMSMGRYGDLAVGRCYFGYRRYLGLILVFVLFVDIGYKTVGVGY